MRRMTRKKLNTMTGTVFCMWHVRPETELSDENIKFIGVFSTELKAVQAREHLVSQPGFTDYPDGFHIDEYALDKLHWEKGFITVSHDEDE